MTRDLLVPLSEAHAGDLIGFNKQGRALYLPGGGARDGAIFTDDGDDGDPDDLGGDGDDGDGDDGELDETPPARPSKPSYKDLLGQIRKLEEGQRRNNSELRKRRLVAQWMEKHSIDDLDEWLNARGIDGETGEVTPAASSAAQTPPAPTSAPPVTQSSPAEPAQGASATPDEAEINRRVELTLQKRKVEDDGRVDTLTAALRRKSLETQLEKLGFSGTFETALRVVDLDSIEIGDDGAITGADSVAADLQREIPEWFKKRTPARVGADRRDGNDVDGADRRIKPPAKQSWETEIAKRFDSGR